MNTNELRQTEVFKKMVVDYGPAVELYLEHFTIEETWSCESPESFRCEFKNKYRFSYTSDVDFMYKMLEKATIAEPLKYYIDSKKYHDDLTGENGGFISFEKNTFFWLFKAP